MSVLQVRPQFRLAEVDFHAIAKVLKDFNLEYSLMKSHNKHWPDGVLIYYNKLYDIRYHREQTMDVNAHRNRNISFFGTNVLNLLIATLLDF